MFGLAGIALFGWVAFRPGLITENLGMWGPRAKWLPDLGRIFGVVIGSLLVVQGIGEVT